MARAIAITCRGVWKRFALVDQGNAWRLAFGGRKGLPTFEALRNISFDVPKGQFVGVLGRNGAGKSTLLRVIGGIYAADRGSVSVDGALSGLYELGLVGNPELTGRAYADRLLNVHGFSARDRAAMIADIQEFSELGHRFDDPVLTYSAGMAARLFFSTATAGHYEVYLLDEILSVGDQHFQAKCWRRLRDRMSRGTSGVLVTHDWSAILKMCQTAHILESGRITFSGPARRAVRLYRHGEAAREHFRQGIARFAARPSYGLQRTPADGRILWSSPAVEIDRLIRAISEPYPGASTDLDRTEIRVWAARPLNLPIHGARGQIAQIPDIALPCVVTGSGTIAIERATLMDGSDALPLLLSSSSKRLTTP